MTDTPPALTALGATIIERLAEAGQITDKMQGPAIGIRAHVIGDGIRILGAAPTPKGTHTAQTIVSWPELIEATANPLVAAIAGIHGHLLAPFGHGLPPAQGSA